MFYQTVDLSSEELEKATARTMKQESLIIAIFKANPTVAISPSQMLSIFEEKYNKHPPITSIRRAMSDLTKDNLLIKTGTMVTGSFSLPEHCWMLRVNNEDKAVEKSLSGVSTAEFANKIIEHSINKTYVQPALFKDMEKENGAL